MYNIVMCFYTFWCYKLHCLKHECTRNKSEIQNKIIESCIIFCHRFWLSSWTIFFKWIVFKYVMKEIKKLFKNHNVFVINLKKIYITVVTILNIHKIIIWQSFEFLYFVLYNIFPIKICFRKNNRKLLWICIILFLKLQDFLSK